jgi:hypothetical protein
LNRHRCGEFQEFQPPSSGFVLPLKQLVNVNQKEKRCANNARKERPTGNDLSGRAH